MPDPGRPLREALLRSGIDYLELGPIFRDRAAAGDRLFFEVELDRRQVLSNGHIRRPGS